MLFATSGLYNIQPSSSSTKQNAALIMCSSRKYPDPHHGGNWKFQGGGGGGGSQRPRKFPKGGGLDHKITFQGGNIISLST